MANWRIIKVTNLITADVALDCVAPAQPYQVYLQDTETGNVEVTAVCAVLDPANPCVLPRFMTLAGYTPADWDTECPA